MHSQGIIVQIMGALKILASPLLLLLQCNGGGYVHEGVVSFGRFSIRRQATQVLKAVI